MKKHKKRKIKKAIARRGKLIEKDRVKTAWFNIFRKSGIIK
ncbi:DUF3983 domain-containing protein [Bacillus cereus]|nr:DUF3983 domain-containing protein [Bacillus cereus]MEB9969421.1 DUF3983 domain-containing protein [Bacillus cereus]